MLDELQQIISDLNNAHEKKGGLEEQKNLWVVPDQFKQLRLRLDPTTLQRANDIQEMLKAAGKNSSLETVIGMAVEELHHQMLPDIP